MSKNLTHYVTLRERLDKFIRPPVTVYICEGLSQGMTCRMLRTSDERMYKVYYMRLYGAQGGYRKCDMESVPGAVLMMKTNPLRKTL